ncbi:MAG: D-alanyl-D-alanine carboxypeptidase family protein [Chitinophagaceae bacterium]|nr:D-alanyl-D-alanine carboxypeptidase family protein [Oligoflexus sp.]
MQRRRLIKGMVTSLAALQSGIAFAQDGGLSKPLNAALAERMQFKAKHFDQDFSDDFYLNAVEKVTLRQVLARLTQVKKDAGFGRFNLLTLDELLKFASKGALGSFTPSEIGFIETIFFRDAKEYGFYGEKVSTTMTQSIDLSKTVKIPGTGHFLFKGRPEGLYAELKRDVGEDIVLTSGIRSIVKQLDLFLSKAAQCGGNLSRASRSLAPPGYSFHGSGDFDVGKIGLGADNFTDTFAATDVYKRLIDLGYVNIRYTETNFYGVRFEPWHIKV